MHSGPLATIINFCTTETRFIKSVLGQAFIFSDQVIVPVCDHFYDGVPENAALLERIYRSFPSVTFVQFPLVRYAGLPIRWNSIARFVGVSELRDDIRTVFFLDADEVVEGERFRAWFGSCGYREEKAIVPACFWYFREPTFQSLILENAGLLISRDALTKELLLDEGERGAIYDKLAAPKRKGVVGPDGFPLVHHYSWVRTREQMLRKVSTWGHHADRPWAALVEEEFARPFGGKDFVHGYEYRLVVPPFEVNADESSFSGAHPSTTKKLGESELMRMILGKRTDHSIPDVIE